MSKIFKHINYSAKVVQKCLRGYHQRALNKKKKDGMTFKLLNRCIDVYNDTIIHEKMINTILKRKKIRLSNFPSHISENIAKFAIYKKYNILPSWDTQKGDLCMQLTSTNQLQLEIKGSIDLEKGLSTFGPTEKWDYIYFVDGKDTLFKYYKVYEIQLSNENVLWKNMQISQTETYQDQCHQRRRPRIRFNEIKKQLGSKCQLIFDNNISHLEV